MRLMARVLAVVGCIVLAAAVVLALAGDGMLALAWLLMGPTPFFLVGWWLCRRRPESTAGLWLLAGGATFLLNVTIGELLLPLVRDEPWAWVPSMVGRLADFVGLVGGLALFGLFPDGRPQRAYERRVLQVVAVVGALLPVVYAITHPTLDGIGNPFYVPAAAPAAGVIGSLNDTFPLLLLLAVVMLVLRYRRTSPAERRRIRWLVLGLSGALVSWVILTALTFVLPPVPLLIADFVLWPMGVVLAIGAVVLAVVYDGVLGIDQPLRRAVVYRALWTLIAVLYVGAATALGLTAVQYLRPAAAVLLAAGAALLFQPVQRRLERVADRWVFGNRLDGYRVLTEFGAALESAPDSAELPSALASSVRDGLGLDWVRVRLDSGPVGTAGDARDRKPELTVPLPGGRIECGPRRDGELVDEDRRLLQHLAGQAAPAIRNLQLTTELTESRARVVEAQDAERRRIQRDLHDGVQQDVVVLTAKLAMARERLRRGDDADRPLTELQADLGRLLGQVREFAHTIHPPVLADQGLLEAVEAQAARLPLAVVIEADTALRGARYPQHVEAATWYVLSEALTNVVKHAGAREVSVTLRQPGGRLVIEIRDDGCGFDPDVPRGLGLTGLADRVAIARGTLRLDSRPGRGTTLCAEIPVSADA
ncbi:sensor histidine kinase [Actinoplanes sp. NPDC051633]|uniref:sensor histidine kinase n=1 Tax=Actinoplanes sp. NPDC051633 TaxID=3155670 RepID=UPI00342854C1